MDPGESSWIGGMTVDLGGGRIAEFVFDSDQKIYVDGVRPSEGTAFYEWEGNDIKSAGGYFSFFAGVWSPSLLGAAPSVVLPPIHTAAADFPSGGYEFKLTNTSGSSATVSVYRVSKEDKKLSEGKLDLNFIIYTAGDQNSVIPDEASAGAIKSLMNEIFGPVGIEIGEVRVEYRNDAAAILQVLDDDGMISFLESASKGTSGRSDDGINCFLFPRLAGNTLGVDGAIPGPGTVHGTAASGIIAQAAPLGWAAGDLTEHETDQFVLAKILAHEIGHYLGLFHTTESNGSAVGAVTDTPRCGPENDTDGDGEVGGWECIGKGSDYLMFWAFVGSLVRTGEYQLTLSSQEGQVCNTHPSVL